MYLIQLNCKASMRGFNRQHFGFWKCTSTLRQHCSLRFGGFPIMPRQTHTYIRRWIIADVINALDYGSVKLGFYFLNYLSATPVVDYDVWLFLVQMLLPGSPRLKRRKEHPCAANGSTGEAACKRKFSRGTISPGGVRLKTMNLPRILWQVDNGVLQDQFSIRLQK